MDSWRQLKPQTVAAAPPRLPGWNPPRSLVRSDRSGRALPRSLVHSPRSATAPLFRLSRPHDNTSPAPLGGRLIRAQLLVTGRSCEPERRRRRRWQRCLLFLSLIQRRRRDPARLDWGGRRGASARAPLVRWQRWVRLRPHRPTAAVYSLWQRATRRRRRRRARTPCQRV